MNFIPYLFKKDLFRLKVIFIAWALLICSQLALGIFSDRLISEFLQAQMIVPMSARLISFLQCLMIIAIVPLIIQNDSLVGTTAFWFTRPISRKGLLFTKSCMIFLLLIAVQLIAELIVLAVQGATTHYLLLAIPEILIWDIAFIIPFMILASVTPKFSRYALAGIIAFAAFVIILIIWSISSIFINKYLPNFHKYLYGHISNSASMELSGKVVRNIYIILAGYLIIAYQFLTRRTVKTVIWVSIAFFVMILGTRFWSWDFLQQATVVNSSAVSSGPLFVKFDANYVSVFDEPRFGKKESREKSVSTREVVSGLSNSEFAILDEIKDVKMKYPDSNSLSSEYILNKQDMITYSDENFMLPIQSALKDEKLLNPYKEVSYSKIFSLDESKFHQYKDKKGDYSAHAVFDVYQYNITSRMPLKTGAKCWFGAQEVVIYDILKKANTISVIINEKKINLVFDRNIKKTSMADIAQHIYSEYDHIYLIVNTKRHEAFLPEAGINLFSGIMELYSESRFKTMAMKLDFTNLNSRNGPLPEIDEQWLADGELVRLNAAKVRVEPVDFTIAGFSIPAQSKGEKGDENEIQKRLKKQGYQ